MGNWLDAPQEPRQFQGKRQQRRPFYTMTTFELLNLLDAEFSKTLSIIQTLKISRTDTREYLCQLMRDTEDILRSFNVEMVGKRPGQHGFDVNQHFKEEMRRLKANNDKLKEDCQKLERMLSENVKDKSMSDKEYDRRAPTSLVPDQNSSRGGTGKHDQNLQSQLEKCREHIQELLTKNARSQDLIAHLTDRNNKLDKVNASLSTEKENLAMRLSKLAGQRLVENNPAIADLSDPNRPTKLGELYSELYDNEWTDALEGLQNGGYVEEEAIITLRWTLINVLEFCKSKSKTLLEKTEDAVNFLFEEFQDFEEQRPLKHLTIKRSQSEQWLKQAHDSSFDGLTGEQIDLQERWKPKSGKNKGTHKQATLKVIKPELDSQLTVFRKGVAESMVPIVQKAYMSASWRDKEFIPELYPFIKKCIFIGWMMVVQSPPMALLTCEKGERFDKNVFKEYTASGPKVLYVVWPALQLHENGPVVGKGTAQGQKGK